MSHTARTQTDHFGLKRPSSVISSVAGVDTRQLFVLWGLVDRRLVMHICPYEFQGVRAICTLLRKHRIALRLVVCSQSRKSAEVGFLIITFSIRKDVFLRWPATICQWDLYHFNKQLNGSSARCKTSIRIITKRCDF